MVAIGQGQGSRRQHSIDCNLTFGCYDQNDVCTDVGACVNAEL
jgi:hypothetical protein